MKILRTPDEQFENLPGYDFEPHYTTIKVDDGAELRIHHIDEGDPSNEPLLLMHGNPSWSYLHRHMIPGLVDTGKRVIAVDLVGCGRSDKPASRDDYTLQRHYDWMEQWLLANELENITLFCQDWGGTIGLYLASILPDRFDRVIVANSGLPHGEGNELMDKWQSMMGMVTEFPFEMVLRQAFQPAISDEEYAGYLAPFPSPEYQAGICKFPLLIATNPNNPGVPIN